MFEIIAFTVIGILLAVLFVFVRLQRIRRGIHRVLSGAEDEQTLPYTQEWELYHNEQAPSQRILACLTELRVDYKSHKIHLVTGFQGSVSKGFMTEVPKFQVPILVHNGRAIYNSRSQMRYLINRHARGALLLSATDEEDTRLAYWLNKLPGIDESDLSLVADPKGNELFTIALPIVGAVFDQLKAKFLARTFLLNPFFRKPIGATALRALTTLSILENPALTNAFETAKEIIEDRLDEAERALGTHGGEWIIGGTFSHIDIEIMVLLYRLQQVTMLDDLLRSGRPNLAMYWERLIARPSFTIALVNQTSSVTKTATEKIRTTRAINPEFDELFRVNH